MRKCSNCLDRNKCVVLCQDAERYVSQDDDPEAWKDITLKETMDEFTKQNQNGLSTCEAILQNYFLDREEVGKIAEKHDVSKSYAYKIIRKYKKIISQNIKKSVQSRS